MDGQHAVAVTYQLTYPTFHINQHFTRVQNQSYHECFPDSPAPVPPSKPVLPRSVRPTIVSVLRPIFPKRPPFTDTPVFSEPESDIFSVRYEERLKQVIHKEDNPLLSFSHSSVTDYPVTPRPTYGTEYSVPLWQVRTTSPRPIRPTPSPPVPTSPPPVPTSSSTNTSTFTQASPVPTSSSTNTSTFTQAPPVPTSSSPSASVAPTAPSPVFIPSSLSTYPPSNTTDSTNTSSVNRSRRPSPISRHESNTGHFQPSRNASSDRDHRLSPVNGSTEWYTDKDSNRNDSEDEDDEDEDEDGDEDEDEDEDEDDGEEEALHPAYKN